MYPDEIASINADNILAIPYFIPITEKDRMIIYGFRSGAATTNVIRVLKFIFSFNVFKSGIAEHAQIGIIEA